MKKQIGSYAVAWVALVGLFNIVCFVVPVDDRFSPNFWTGYGLVTAAFILHFIYAYKALSDDNARKRVLNTTLMTVSFTELILMVIVGIISMLTPIPYWVGIILCYVIFAFSIVFLISAKNVEVRKFDANDRLNQRTHSFRELTSDAQEVVSAARTPEIRAIVQEVADALRYSDPTTSEATWEDERQIKRFIQELSKAISDELSQDEIEAKTDALLLLIEKRNNKCRNAK